PGERRQHRSPRPLPGDGPYRIPSPGTASRQCSRRGLHDAGTTAHEDALRIRFRVPSPLEHQGPQPGCMNGDHMDKSKQVMKQTLVEEGTELKGTLKSTCQVVVTGAIDGKIEAPALTITGTGSVIGSVKAQKLRSEGTLAGDIDADD